MGTPKHAPIPWEITRGFDVRSKGSGEFVMIAEGVTGQAKANIDCIVKSVNCHDEMLAVLKELQTVIWGGQVDEIEFEEVEVEEISIHLLDRLAKVIAKAERTDL